MTLLSSSVIRITFLLTLVAGGDSHAQSITPEGFAYTAFTSNAVVTGYTGAGGAITVPASIQGLPVYTIGASAFANKTSITRVTLPDTLISIGAGAFEGCTGLAVVVVPNGVRNLGDRAYFNCSSLKSLALPGTLTQIGASAFSGCSSLTSVAIPSSVTTLGASVFANCTQLTNLGIYGNAPTAGAGMFTNSGLRTVYYASGKSGWASSFGGLPTAALVPPGIATPPQSQVVAAGGSITFSVVATGAPAPWFQWRKNGEAIPAATNALFTLPDVRASNAGSYDVVAYNNLDAPAISLVATLTVTGTTSDGYAYKSSGANVTITGYSGAGGPITIPAAIDGVPVASPDGLDVWSWRNPLPQGNDLMDVAWNGAVAVAVGARGTIITSPDGINWSGRASGAKTSFHRVVWTGSRFVAVGDGNVISSSNGTEWSIISTGLTAYGLCWNGAQFVAVGTQGGIATSPDGNIWTRRTSGTASNLFGIAWSGSQFVAVGWNGTIVSSADGITWQSRTSGTTTNFSNVAWTGSQFAAVANAGIFTSTDGAAWANRDASMTTCRNIQWVGNQLVAVGSSEAIWTSANAALWTVRNSGGFGSYASVVYTGSQYIVVGTGGRLATSPTGANWTNRRSSTSAWLALRKVAWAGGRFVAVGTNGAIQTSSDGFAWVNRTQSTLDWFYDVAWSGQQYVVVGSSSAGASVWTSTDGASWLMRTSGLPQALLGILWDGTKYVAVGVGGTLATSTDGISWSNQTSPTTSHLRSCAWNQSQYVAVGDEGTILSSNDGVRWVVQRSGTGEQMTGVAWGGGKFVAVAGSGGSARVLTSVDGSVWVDRTPAGASIWNLLSVAWTGSEFVAVGGLGFIATSADGVNWSERSVVGAGASWGVAANGEQVMVVGDGGILGAIRQLPAISVMPKNASIVVNERTILNVAATGMGELSYQWYLGSSGDTSLPINGATSAMYTTPPATGTRSYWVRIADRYGNAKNSLTAIIAVAVNSPLTVAHSVMGTGYQAGAAVVVTNTITYSGSSTESVTWSALLPAGWKYLGSGGSEGSGPRPVYESGDLIEWSWTSLPTSPIRFTYMVSVPPGATGDQVIASLVTSQQTGTTYQTMAKPDPLVIRSLSLHSGDANRDGAINLNELTRVIELYNYRSGTVRTGKYRIQAGTEDGFAPGP